MPPAAVLQLRELSALTLSPRQPGAEQVPNRLSYLAMRSDPMAFSNLGPGKRRASMSWCAPCHPLVECCPQFFPCS